jgi:putative CocE/NonD family hydrolase
MMNAPILTWTGRGYAVVVQDCRGTGRSEGDFRFMVNEGPDGVDAIAWCAEQPWSSGSVGMFGSSYLSST